MIRPATPEDTATIFGFVKELAEYEKLAHEVTGSQDDIHNHLFGEERFCHALIAEEEGEPVGFALYFTTYSTFLCKPGLYLEDLYITPSKRGHGHGLALMKALAEIAVARGYGRFEWSALDWNTPAIDFYTSLGAEEKSEWNVYRLSGPPLARLTELTLK